MLRHLIGNQTRNFSRQLTVEKILKLNEKSEDIKVKGWVKSLRKMKEHVFLDVSDGSCDKKLQILIASNNKPDNLTVGSSICATGMLSLSPKGNLELNASSVDVIGSCNLEDGYPFAPRKTYAPEYIRQYLHLRNRTNKFSSLLRIRNVANLEFHKYLNEKGFVNIHTPILTSNDCEGAGEVFLVCPDNKDVLKAMAKEGVSEEEAYFDSKVYLTVSGQLHLEAAAHGLHKVYTFGPTFRAENSRSRLHLSEFYMLEAEAAFVEDLDDIIGLIESLTKGVTQQIVGSCGGDLKAACENAEISFNWLDKPFPVITHDEAVWILKKLNPKFDGKNFTKEDEISLVKHCGNLPTFVINFPKDEKPFYMRECSHDCNKVAALDLLGPHVGEIVGGSLRENDFEKLKNKLPVGKNLDWYLDLRKFGGVPTGGFGLGFERYLQMILGVNSIKDVIPYPRWPHNCTL